MERVADVRPRWKQIRYRLELFGCLAVAKLIPRLPRRFCLLLARVLGRLHWTVDRRGRAVALANLQATFGERFSPGERVRIARASFGNFARAMLDLFWARRLDRTTHRRWMRLVGFDQAAEIRAKYGSNLFIVMHYGSYEWLSLGAGFFGLTVTIVAQDFKNESLAAIFARARQVSGHRLIGRAGAQSMLRMLRAMRHGGGTGLLVDLTLRPDQPSVVIDTFGGLKMCVTFLHALLHERTGVPMTPLTNVPHPDGTGTITAHPPLTFPAGTSRQEVAQACWDWFEPMIRERPELWLWNYKHFRYRPTTTTATADPPASGSARYPFYARPSREFDRLAAAGD